MDYKKVGESIHEAVAAAVNAAEEANELPTAPEKPSVLRRVSAEEVSKPEPVTSKAAEPATAKPETAKTAEACPHCGGNHAEKRFKLHIEVDILVDSKKEAKEISRMYETLGGVLQGTGSPVQMRSDIYGKHGDDGHDPNMN